MTPSSLPDLERGIRSDRAVPVQLEIATPYSSASAVNATILPYVHTIHASIYRSSNNARQAESEPSDLRPQETDPGRQGCVSLPCHPSVPSLPVLSAAKLVDSGGQMLVCVCMCLCSLNPSSLSLPSLPRSQSASPYPAHTHPRIYAHHTRTPSKLADRDRQCQHERGEVARWLVSPLLPVFAHACRPSHLASRMSPAHTHAHPGLAGTPPRTDTCARAPSLAHTHNHTLCLWACSRRKGEKHEQAARRTYYN